MRAHDMLPENSHDEQAMQDFVRSFRRFLRTDVMPGARDVFENKVEPDFRERNGRSFDNYHEVRKAMTRNDFYQLWSAMQRRSQELMWESVIAPTERQMSELVEHFNELAGRRPADGSLRLDPDLEIPRYHTAVDIHLQPGGYHTDFTADDVSAGVLYEAGLPIYIDGELGPLSDGIGAALLGFCKANYPEISPRRILDMGCAVGNSTLPWVGAYPEADVHAIDVGAPCLRFAHARAESLGARIHLSQQNAEHTDFDDESFDLVVSHIVLHETSKPALRNIIAETHRLLRPGGLMMHLDVPRGEGAFEQFMSQWETYNNNEVFSAYMTDVDLPALAADVGFAPENVRMAGARPEDGVHHAYNESGFAWPVLVGSK
jgi:2-polyprenyl-3-methyl-5-hydroxy-6-metoxy-1,4-benzoquinol methylase